MTMHLDDADALVFAVLGVGLLIAWVMLWSATLGKNFSRVSLGLRVIDWSLKLGGYGCVAVAVLLAAAR